MTQDFGLSRVSEDARPSPSDILVKFGLAFIPNSEFRNIAIVNNHLQLSELVDNGCVLVCFLNNRSGGQHFRGHQDSFLTICSGGVFGQY